MKFPKADMINQHYGIIHQYNIYFKTMWNLWKQKNEWTNN